MAPVLLTLGHSSTIEVRAMHQRFEERHAVSSGEQTMKLARVGAIASAILAVATVAWAQKPDFSGTWTLDAASASAAGGGRGGGALGNGPATVRQTADALTIERTMGDDKVTLTYKLDGAESRNTMMSRDGQAADSVSTARWDGPRLTIVTKQEMGGQLSESTQVWTVDGSTLTVETTSARGAQKRVYKK
jgi:hypothetical protein